MAPDEPDEQDPLVGAALVALAFGCLAVSLLLWSCHDLLAIVFCTMTRGLLP